MSDDHATQSNSGSKSNGNGSGNANGNRAFLLQQLYVKAKRRSKARRSLSSPASSIEPETELNIRNSHSASGENLYEVILHVSVHAKKGEQTIFLTEIDQAGLFLLSGYSPEQTNMLLGTQCPATLFPFAREAISSLVGKGGFPPLILQPINFDALYAQAREQQSAQA